jgi:hypothetical protein
VEDANGRVLARRSRPVLGPLAVAVGLVASGCASELAVTATPTPLAVPADWAISTSSAHDLRLALPPWIVAFDTTGAIFANEVVEPGAQGLELLAEGPLSVEPQPRFGEDLRAWLAARLADTGAGEPVFRDVLLPAGPAVMVERIDRPATTTARQHRAWAIRTPAGVAFLSIDGPPGAWDAREDDLARIPMFLEVTR